MILEEFILSSTNQPYAKRLFTDLPAQYMKTTSSEHVVYMIFLLFIFILAYLYKREIFFLYSKIRFFSTKQEILNILIFDASLACLLWLTPFK